MTNDLFFNKIISNNIVYYLYITYKLEDIEENVNIKIYEDNVCYHGKISKDYFEELSNKAGQQLNEFRLKTLDILTSKFEVREDVEIIKDSANYGNFIKLIWKKVLTDNLIKKQLGSILLEKETKSNTFSTLMDSLATVYHNQKEHILKLKSENELLLKQNKDTIKMLHEYATIKEDTEKDLYSKFFLVLNSKKRKLKELKYYKKDQDSDNDDENDIADDNDAINEATKGVTSQSDVETDDEKEIDHNTKFQSYCEKFDLFENENSFSIIPNDEECIPVKRQRKSKINSGKPNEKISAVSRLDQTRNEKYCGKLKLDPKQIKKDTSYNEKATTSKNKNNYDSYHKNTFDHNTMPDTQLIDTIPIDENQVDTLQSPSNNNKYNLNNKSNKSLSEMNTAELLDDLI